MRVEGPPILLLLAAAAVLGGFTSSSANALTASASGYWTNTATWGGLGPPGPGDDVVINSGITVTATVSTASLGSLTNNGILVFSGWSTLLTATSVRINGQVTHLPQSATTTNEFGVWVADNRVHIACTNLVISSTGSIDVSRKGYQAGVNGGGYGPGGGAGGTTYGGGGYGGAGGVSTGGFGVAYGSMLDPQDPGSGGGGGASGGLAGGGAVRIIAADDITVDGAIVAGANAWGMHTWGAGSGGSIYISCRTIRGSGRTMADGDNHYSGASGTPGGGGRIAVHFDPTAQSNVTPRAAVVFSAGGGFHPERGKEAAQGTIYLPSPVVLSENIMGGIHTIPGFTSWGPTNVGIGGWGYAVFTNGFTLAISNDLVFTNYGGLLLSNAASLAVGRDLVVSSRGLVNLFLDGTSPSTLSVGRDLIVTNQAVLNLYSAPTNLSSTTYGTLVSVGRNISVYTNSYLKPWSQPVNGGSILFRCSTFLVATGATVDANYTGFAGGVATNGFGPGGGQGTLYAGGGYGGAGGYAAGNYGKAYGSSNEPVDPGSGGGGGTGLRGGGLIRVEAMRGMLYGTLTASDTTWSGHTIGCGSGGGIYLRCRYLEGNGVLRADGGNHYSGSGGSCGGGGRIAVWSAYDSFLFDTNRVTVKGGDSPDPARWGQPGTIVWRDLPLAGTIIQLR